MKKILLAMLLSMVFFCSYGQSGRVIYGCVYGKGKTPLAGALISTVHGEKICLTDANGQFNTSTRTYVSKIKVSHEGYTTHTIDVDGSYMIINLGNIKKERIKKQFEPVKRGWQQSIECSANLDFSNNNNRGDDLYDVGVRYIGGWRINNTFFVGIGTGIDFVVYDHFRDNHYGKRSIDHEGACPSPHLIMIPLFIHARAYLSKKNCQPYFSISAGARFSLTEGHLELYRDYSQKLVSKSYGKTSYFFEPAFGLSFRTSNRSSVYFQVGGILQTRPFYSSINRWQGKISNQLTGGFTLKIGCTF